jgi:hypothetical protein
MNRLNMSGFAAPGIRSSQLSSLHRPQSRWHRKRRPQSRRSERFMILIHQCVLDALMVMRVGSKSHERPLCYAASGNRTAPREKVRGRFVYNPLP